MRTGISAALLLCAAAMAKDPSRFEAAEPHMGTLFSITAYARDEPAARAAFRAAFDRVEQLDAVFSDYKPDSESMRLRASPQPVSPELYAILEKARRLSLESGGAFDVTIGALTHLWRDARGSGAPPKPDEIEAARARSGFSKMALGPVNNTVDLRVPGMLLDLGGIAKGYAAAEALAILRARGIPSALVAAGGDLAIGDPPPNTSGWRVGIDLPGPAATPLTLRNTSVSTSGDTEQFIAADGKRYSHIVDPYTGMALTQRIGVTVIASDGAIADSYATALSVLAARHGIDDALAWAHRHEGIRARIVMQTSSGWIVRETPKTPSAYPLH